MQNGSIVRHGKWWLLRYWRDEVVNGKTVRKRAGVRLARIGPEYPTAASVRHLTVEHLAPQNARTATPVSADTVESFLESYLVHCAGNLRPSSVKSYRDLFRLVRPHLNGALLRDFRTSHVDKLLRDVAASKSLAHTRLRNCKNFLSSAFRFAKRSDLLADNPVRDSVIPRGKPARETHAYSLDEIQQILRVLDEPARTVVLVAALTGLRHSELRGLRWEDLDGDELTVRRGVWGSHVSDTKTLTSRAAVPLLPIVREALEEHRARNGSSEWVFHGDTGKPLVLANVVRRMIIPALERAGLEWHGWHAFRRGLATNLYALGAPDKTVQAILRHSQVATTMTYYVKGRQEDSQAAMNKLAAAFGRAAGRARRTA